MLARLGKYLLFDRINRGGMAEVFMARTFDGVGAPRFLVIKCIRRERSADPAFVAMFLDEAKLSVALDHPNIAHTYELGCISSRYFLTMEYVYGRDLRDVLDRLRGRGQRLPEPLALHVAAHACAGLQYAHELVGSDGEPLHIVHRDVSPQNVIVGFDGDAKLIDFGIAKVTAQSRQRSRVLKGKYGYMAPEQARGHAVDARSDVFAAGAVLFELLTGRRLFTGRREQSILAKVRAAEVYPPRLANPEVSAAAEAVALRALAAHPDERFASAAELRRAIEELAGPGAEARKRELAVVMRELFAADIADERARFAAVAALTAMPTDARPLDEVAASAAGAGGEGDAEGEDGSPDDLDTAADPGIFAAFEATRVTDDEGVERRRNVLIIGGAAVVALSLVLLALVA